MTWPQAFAAVGITWAIAAIFWASAWVRKNDDATRREETPEWDKQDPFRWTSETKTYIPCAQPAKVTPADSVPKPKGK